MPRWRFRYRLPLPLSIVGVLLGGGLFVVGMAWWQAQGSRLLQPNDLIIPRLVDVTVALWCFWVASSIGSFLNVVAWRMPRGGSLNGRSHCPRCAAQLRARDNFPVLGWLALGGRCHTCRLPISPRYPIVEATVGVSLASVAVSQLYRYSLPYQGTFLYGPLWAPTIDPPILLTALYHCVVLAFSWAYGLIRLDGHRLPNRLVFFAMAALIVPMLVYPTVMVVPWKMIDAPVWRGDGQYVDAVARVLTSLVAAALIGRSLAWGFCPAADPKLNPLAGETRRLIDLIAMLAIPAVLVGWQSAAAIAVVASIIAAGFSQRWGGTGGGDALGRFALAIPLTLTLQLVFWRWLHHWWWWPADDSSPWVILAWAAMILLVPLWLSDRKGRLSQSA